MWPAELVFVCWNSVAVTWLCSALSVASGIILAPVYWNASNPIFKSSQNRLIIDVNLYDEIDFVCPHYPPPPAPLSSTAAPAGRGSDNEVDEIVDDVRRSVEYYIVYQVTRLQYDRCYIDALNYNDVAMIVNCSEPLQRRRYTILFEPFQSIPNAPEYMPGRSYYYLTTSTGSRDGLSNVYRGACFHSNMKLVVRVCCDVSQYIGQEKTKSSSVHSKQRRKYSDTDDDDDDDDAENGDYEWNSLLAQSQKLADSGSWPQSPVTGLTATTSMLYFSLFELLQR